MTELISIIMTVSNSTDFIEDAVKSVIAQHYQNWELIIVEDYGTVHSQNVLSHYLALYPNIRYSDLKKEKDLAGFLQQLKGDYIAFLDSDTLWTPNKLSLQMDFMKENKVAFSATGYELIQKARSSKWIAFIPPQKMDYNKMLSLAYPVSKQTIMYDRRLVGDLQIQSLKELDDLSLCLQILHKIPFCWGIQDILTKHRREYPKEKLFLAYRWNLYRCTEKFGPIKAIWCIICWKFIKALGLGMKKVNLKKYPKPVIADSVVYYE